MRTPCAQLTSSMLVMALGGNVILFTPVFGFIISESALASAQGCVAFVHARWQPGYEPDGGESRNPLLEDSDIRSERTQVVLRTRRVSVLRLQNALCRPGEVQQLAPGPSQQVVALGTGCKLYFNGRIHACHLPSPPATAQRTLALERAGPQNVGSVGHLQGLLVDMCLQSLV